MPFGSCKGCTAIGDKSCRSITNRSCRPSRVRAHFRWWPLLAAPTWANPRSLTGSPSSRRSIVGDEPGITRDRIYGEYVWLGRHYRVVDTGGMVPDDAEVIPTEIYAQAQVALEEADALVMVVDARTELASPDYDLARMLIRGGKPLFLAVNKVEGEAMSRMAENFRQLGIRNVFSISSEHGWGIGDLLDAIAEAIPAQTEAGDRGRDPELKKPRLATKLKKFRRMRSPPIGRMESLSSTKPRWRSSGGRMWASLRCSMR